MTYEDDKDEIEFVVDGSDVDKPLSDLIPEDDLRDFEVRNVEVKANVLRLTDIKPGHSKHLYLDISITVFDRRPGSIGRKEIAEMCYQINPENTIQTYKRCMTSLCKLGYMEEANDGGYQPTDAGREKWRDLGLYTPIDDRVDPRPR